MEKKAKLIWEFFGEDGLETAKHHAIHLEEFAQKENTNYNITTKKELIPVKGFCFYRIFKRA